MIYRFMFVGYSDDVHSVRCTKDERYYTALSCKDNMVFMYVESNEDTVNPNILAKGNMICYPDGEKWKRASEIFHYSKPISGEQWKRKVSDKKPDFTFGRLKQEKVASYIFYHYQSQEEKGGQGLRYGIIFLFGDMLIFYHETPTEEETEHIEGLLKTQNTPKDKWGVLMNEHFAKNWQRIETLDFTEYIDFN